MSEPLNDRYSTDGPSEFDLRAIEETVRAAGGYVGASRDLRPRVLEAVRGRQGVQRLRQRATLLAAVAAVVVFAAVARSSAVGRALAAGASRQQLAIALEEASEQRAGFDGLCWGLVDAWQRVRGSRAAAFASRGEEGSSRSVAQSGASAGSE